MPNTKIGMSNGKSGFDPIDIDGKVTIYDATKLQQTQSCRQHNNTYFYRTRQAFGTGTHHTTQMIISRPTGAGFER
jgi:ribosomal protein L11 methylase PrmA